jgi:hypothetical protein
MNTYVTGTCLIVIKILRFLCSGAIASVSPTTGESTESQHVHPDILFPLNNPLMNAITCYEHIYDGDLFTRHNNPSFICSGAIASVSPATGASTALSRAQLSRHPSKLTQIHIAFMSTIQLSHNGDYVL